MKVLISIVFAFCFVGAVYGVPGPDVLTWFVNGYKDRNIVLTFDSQDHTGDTFTFASGQTAYSEKEITIPPGSAAYGFRACFTGDWKKYHLRIGAKIEGEEANRVLFKYSDTGSATLEEGTLIGDDMFVHGIHFWTCSLKYTEDTCPIYQNRMPVIGYYKGQLSGTVNPGFEFFITIGNDDHGLADWMYNLTPGLKFYQLSLPGTHDSASWVLNKESIGKCQNWDWISSLNNGIRAFDLRFGNQAGKELNFRHGFLDLKYDFTPAMENMIMPWLKAHPSEFLVFFVKDDDIWPHKMSSEEFTTKFEYTTNLIDNDSRWKRTDGLSNFIWLKDLASMSGDISELRGRILVIGREGTENNAAYIDNWPDNCTGTATIQGWSKGICIEDHYKCGPEMGAKEEAIAKNLYNASKSEPSETIYMTFSSGFYKGDCQPDAFANEINPMLKSYLCDGAKYSGCTLSKDSRVGIIMMDFANQNVDVIKNIISRNPRDPDVWPLKDKKGTGTPVSSAIFSEHELY